MTGKPAASKCDHPAYPEDEAEFGEDPARIIYHMDPQPRIRGIGDTALVRAYLDVETDRDSPRREVIAACNRRLDELDALAAAGGQQPAVATDGGERR